MTGEAVSVEREFTIKNREGLHFRPIMQMVEVANKHASTIAVDCDGRKADGRSPMELLMLVATAGAKLRVVADGEDAEKLLDEWAGLFESGFGET